MDKHRLLKYLVLFGLFAVAVMAGVTYASAHEHDIAYCSNGDGTHYVYCTHAGCSYHRTEECAYIEGECPYCGYEYPVEEVDDLKEYSKRPISPDYASSYKEYDGHDYEYIAESEDGEESTEIISVVDISEDEEEGGEDLAEIIDLEPVADGDSEEYEEPEETEYAAEDAGGGVATDWYNFTPDEITILAQAMRHEAGNQPEAGKIGVVEVILNRMRSPYFSQNTVSGIVYAPRQFSYISRSKNITPTAEELALVKDIVSGRKRVFNNPDVLYFRNTEVTSGFPNSKAVDWGPHKYATYIQDHSFYYQ